MAFLFSVLIQLFQQMFKYSSLFFSGFIFGDFSVQIENVNKMAGNTHLRPEFLFFVWMVVKKV